jgi:hypothetical protein
MLVATQEQGISSDGWRTVAGLAECNAVDDFPLLAKLDHETLAVLVNAVSVASPKQFDWTGRNLVDGKVVQMLGLYVFVGEDFRMVDTLVESGAKSQRGAGKLVGNELNDIANDPGERTNVAAQSPEIFARLNAKIQQRVTERRPPEKHLHIPDNRCLFLANRKMPVHRRG